MKYIITESQKTKLRLIRRLSDIDAMLHFKMVKCTNWFNVCEMGVSKFIETIKTMISDEMYQNYFEDIQSDSEIIELKKFIENYINTKHIDKIKEFYKNYCAV